MPALDDHCREKLALLDAKGLARAPVAGERQAGAKIRRGGRELVSFACNDYLGLSRHPEVIAAAQEACARYGAGAGASRLVTGEHPLYAPLEAALAEAKGCEAACVFGSGYMASLGVIPALVGEGDVILADKLVHACMIDAARLSGAKLLRFAHNDVAHARRLLEVNRGAYRHCLLLTETVFSMDGDCAPVAELAALAREFDGWLMTDDAHGMVGEPHASAGAIRMGTLSKAIGGYGGYVCGSQALVHYLKSAARSVIYTTGLPPALAASALAALGVMRREPELVQLPLVRARQFTALMGLPEAQSAIVPLVLGSNERALAAAGWLEESGFLVAAIRPPTVPEGTARLRFAFSALHSEAQVEALAAAVHVCVS